MGWLADEQTDLAVSQILDGAGRVFAAQGVRAATMTDIADAAGCSRATVYRYFPTRDHLRLAYVNRESTRLTQLVGAATQHIDDPEERLTEALVLALTEVRDAPALSAWFSVADQGVALRLALASDVVNTIADGSLGPVGDRTDAQWIVRILLSLLAAPGASPDDERDVIRRYVVRPLVSHPDTEGIERRPAAARTG
jgi:AcrR family transcriptional regulator